MKKLFYDYIMPLFGRKDYLVNISEISELSKIEKTSLPLYLKELEEEY
ncbi:dexx-box atpase [Thermosipho africanus Ob7]|nr:hypothetical protein [Thermosipho africanus]RDI90871.1 dexx-box atpase [Thermosipho africanus Ob7]